MGRKVLGVGSWELRVIIIIIIIIIIVVTIIIVYVCVCIIIIIIIIVIVKVKVIVIVIDSDSDNSDQSTIKSIMKGDSIRRLLRPDLLSRVSHIINSGIIKVRRRRVIMIMRVIMR